MLEHCCSHSKQCRNKVEIKLFDERCVSLNIVVANRLVYTTIKCIILDYQKGDKINVQTVSLSRPVKCEIKREYNSIKLKKSHYFSLRVSSYLSPYTHDQSNIHYLRVRANLKHTVISCRVRS